MVPPACHVMLCAMRDYRWAAKVALMCMYVVRVCACMRCMHIHILRVEDLCVCDNNCTAVCTAAVIYLLLQVYCCCCWLFGGGTEYFISSVEKVLLLLSGNRVTPIIILS